MRGSGSAKLGFTSPEGFDTFQHHSLGLEIHQDGLNKKPCPLALIWGSSHYQRAFSSPRGAADDSRSPVPSSVRCCCVTWQNRYSCGCAEAPTCFSAPGRRNVFTQMESGTRSESGCPGPLHPSHRPGLLSKTSSYFLQKLGRCPSPGTPAVGKDGTKVWLSHGPSTHLSLTDTLPASRKAGLLLK